MAEVRWRKGTTPKLLVSTGIDLTSNSGLKLHFKKPGGTTFTRDESSAPNAVSDNSAPTAGQLAYTFLAADLDESGTWQVVPEVNKSADAEIYKGVPAATFTVIDDFDT